MSEVSKQTIFVPRLHHFGISVADLEETVEWYREKLGFEPLYHYELPDFGMRVAFLARDGFRIEVFEVGGSSPLPDHARETSTDLGIQGLKHVAFAVGNLDEAMAELGGRGVAFATGALEVPDSGGERFAFFRDNNGILIELYEPVAAHERVGGAPSDGDS